MEEGKRWIPPHYQKQVEYYTLLLSKHGYGVDNAFVVFITTEPPRIEPIRLGLRPLDQVQSEMLQKKSVLSQALDQGSPPDRTIGWTCRYCSFAPMCFREEQPVSSELRVRELESKIAQLQSELESLRGIQTKFDQLKALLEK